VEIVEYVSYVSTKEKQWAGSLAYVFGRVALGWHKIRWHRWHWSITMSQCLWKREKHKHCNIVIGQCHQCHPTLYHPSAIRVWPKRILGKLFVVGESGGEGR